MRSKLAMLALLSVIAPGAAQAAPCNDINVYSRMPVAGLTAISWDPLASVGCPMGEDTDLILPGSDGTITFFESRERPVDGQVLEGGALAGSYIDVAGRLVPLTFKQGVNAQGAPAYFWFSQDVPHPQEESVLPGFTATAHVCLPDDECQSRTYRSMTTD